MKKIYGQRIRNVLLLKDLTQKQLAIKLANNEKSTLASDKGIEDLTDKYVNLVNRWVNFKAEPELKSLQAIGDVLNIADSYLVGEIHRPVAKFFEGEEFSMVEIVRGLSTGVAAGDVIPVYACSGYNMEAVDLVLDAMVYDVPSAEKAAGEIAKDADGNEVELKCDENGDLAAICFKTVADPFVGKMSFVKVISGKITSDTPCYNARTGKSQRMGKLVAVKGIKQEDINEIATGDIGVITKLDDLATGDTICSAKDIINLEGIDFPAPSLSMAVVVKKKGEEDKVAAGVRKIISEDPTVTFVSNDETKEMAKEIVRCDGLDRTYMALDYFDASINRISAWTVGFRSWQKALLSALITPNDMLRQLQEDGNMTRLMVMQEEVKTLPFGDIWTKYCEECGVAADENWLEDVLRYEKEVLAARV